MASPNPLESLPLELKQELLCALPDILSLRSTILSCYSFYNAFIATERLITTRVLKNQLNAEILPEAVAALQASQSRPRSRQRTLDFIDEHLHTRAPPPDSWTLSNAWSMSRLHFSVESFAASFVAEMLNPSSEFAYIDAPPAWPLSRNEMNRIQRAFYRFEIYFNLFRDPDLFGFHEKKKPFFFNFSHWENEQLACIYDYLYRATCPAFNAVVEYGGERWDEVDEVDVVMYGDDFDCLYIQYLLSLGLVRLQEFIQSDSFKIRDRVLSDRGLGSRWENIYESLKHANRSDDGVSLSDYTTEDEEKLARRHAPFVQDPETGPADAWRWAHQDETRYNFVISDSQTALRSRGYCMWDRARLDQWSVFQSPWEAPEYPFHGDEQVSRKAGMQMWKERHRR